MTKKKNVKKGKHHHLMWLSPQISAYEKDEKNHYSWISTISLPCTSFDPNHGYSLTFFLLNSTTPETNRTLEWLCEENLWEFVGDMMVVRDFFLKKIVKCYFTNLSLPINFF